MENKINYRENPKLKNPIYAIVDILKSEGYKLADKNGYRLDEKITHDTENIGILKPNKSIPKKFLGIISYNDYVANSYIGKIDLDLTNKEEYLIKINVYGRQNVQRLKEIAKKIISKTEMPLELILEEEEEFKEKIRHVGEY